MKTSFFYLDGFFVSWETQSGQCRVFTKSASQANGLFASLKKTNEKVEKFRVENGKMKKLA